MKTFLKVFVIIVVLAGLAVGGVYIYSRVAGSEPVDVTPVSNWMLTWMPNQSYIYGNVVSDGSQSLYKDKDRAVLEVYVQEGDTVKAGDPLVRYDSTLDELTLESKLLEREKLYNKIQDLYKEYKEWAWTDYTERTVATHTPTPSPTPRAYSAVRIGIRTMRDLTPISGSGNDGDPFRYTVAVDETIPTDVVAGLIAAAQQTGAARFALFENEKFTVELRAATDGTISFSVTAADPTPYTIDLQTPSSGEGTESSPYVYAYASAADVPAAFLFDLKTAAETREAAVYSKLTASGFVVSLVSYADGSISLKVSITEATPTPTPTPTETPTPTPEETEEPYVPIYTGPSRAERLAYARQVAEQIRSQELQYRQLSLDITKLQLAGSNGVVYARIDGTVSKSVDPASVQTGESYLVVSGGTGLHLISVIGEMDLEKYPVGTELVGYSYSSGNDVPVRVTEIGTMPYSTQYSNGGNPNSSGYLVRMDFVGDVTPEPGEYIEFTYRPGNSESMNYLFEAYIREIDGQDCIFLAKEGVLVKTPVKTGKRVDSYVEILNIQLDPSDYIAFPYDKNAKDGAPVKVPSENETMVIW